MANAYRICQELGITLHSRKDIHPCELPPRHTWARKSITDIGAAAIRTDIENTLKLQKPKSKRQQREIFARVRQSYRGINPEICYDILGLFLTSEENSCQLYGDMIQGLAKWAYAQRVKHDEFPFLAEHFAEIDFQAIRQEVLHHKIPVRPAQIALLFATQTTELLEALRS